MCMSKKREGTRSYQFLDAAMLADRAASTPELGHVSNGLSGQALEVFVHISQDLHHGL